MPLGAGCTPIDPREMLQLIEKQLRDAGTPTGSIQGAGLGSDAFLSLWPDQLHLKNPRSKRFTAIRPARFPVWQSIVSGSGAPYSGFQSNYTMFGFNLVFTLSMFVQLNADPEMRSQSTLTEDTLSVVAYTMLNISALELWAPTDGSGNLLVREPVRLLDGGFQMKPVQSGTEWWANTTADFECRFTAKLPKPGTGTNVT